MAVIKKQSKFIVRLAKTWCQESLQPLACLCLTGSTAATGLSVWTSQAPTVATSLSVCTSQAPLQPLACLSVPHRHTDRSNRENKLGSKDTQIKHSLQYPFHLTVGSAGLHFYSSLGSSQEELTNSSFLHCYNKPISKPHKLVPRKCRP